MGRSHGLRVWHAARLYAAEINVVVAQLPKRTPVGLRSQLTTAARSVSNCIAEGAGRGTRGERLHYYRMARGSLEETQDHLRELKECALIDRATFFRLWNRSQVIDRMLAKLIDGLERGEN